MNPPTQIHLVPSVFLPKFQDALFWMPLREFFCSPGNEKIPKNLKMKQYLIVKRIKTPAPFKKIEKIKGYLKFCCMLFCGTILIQPWTELFSRFNFVFCCNWNGILFWWEGLSCIYINIFSQWNAGVFYDINKTTKKGCFRESRRYSSFLKLLRKFFPFYWWYGIYVFVLYLNNNIIKAIPAFSLSWHL